MKTKYSLTIDEGESFWMLAAPKGPSGDTIFQAAVSAATLKVFDRSSATPNTSLLDKTLTVTANPPVGDNCMFDAEQEDGNWEGLSGGYTFWTPFHPADYVLEGGKVYEIEVELVADNATGSTFPALDDNGVVAMTWVVSVNGRASD